MKPNNAIKTDAGYGERWAVGRLEPLLKLGSAVHRSLMCSRAQQTRNDF
jgi:hypothetical protein